MQLTKNFTLKEMLVSQTASRNGFTEQYAPSQQVINNLKKVCEQVLQPVRDEFGVINVSSGYRCKRVNQAVGSSEGSDHRRGLAADFISPIHNELTLAKWIQKNINYDQLILEFGTLKNPSWIHVGIGGSMRNQILHIGNRGTITLTRTQLQAL